MLKSATILALAATLSGCADMVTTKRGQPLEQEAVSTAISLCKKFGHKPNTKEYTICVETRYDEVILNRR